MREFELLEHVYASVRETPDRVRVGPGDDMAVVRLAGRDLLAAVDQVVDGRHVTLATTPPGLVGRKSVLRSLSDVAAMAARPVAALAAATLPPDFGTDRANALFDGMREAAEEHDCPLIGGDIAFHAATGHAFTCAITVLAEPGPCGAVLRSGARPGDTVYVTGRLGGTVDADGGGRHLSFEPRIDAGLELAATLGDRLHAMIDISDGLGRDAGHLAEGCGHRIEIEAARIPCAQGVDWRRAIAEGEDYELLFAAAGDVPAVIAGDLLVTPVGRVAMEVEAEPTTDRARAPARVIVRDGDRAIRGDDLGWEHGS